MLETCENCRGKGKTHELPPKRCPECKGKGMIEIEAPFIAVILQSADLVDLSVSQITATANEEEFQKIREPWYKRIFK